MYIFLTFLLANIIFDHLLVQRVGLANSLVIQSTNLSTKEWDFAKIPSLIRESGLIMFCHGPAKSYFCIKHKTKRINILTTCRTVSRPQLFQISKVLHYFLKKISIFFINRIMRLCSSFCTHRSVHL